jgi:hypothetical protein
MRPVFALLLYLALPAAMAQQAPGVEAPVSEVPRWQTLDAPAEKVEPGPPRVGLEQSPAAPPPARTLEVGLVVFDTGIDGDSLENRQLGIFPEVREAEARYLPFALRRTLVDSNHWGAVRVLPNSDPGYELLVSGRILVSNGAELSLAITAIDSRDAVWLDKTYSAIADENAYLETERRLRRPFQDLYNEFANDLLAVRRSMDSSTLRRIREISELRYAATLLPDAFDEYLQRDESGLVRLARLPAKGDPMLSRIRRVREQEYLFIDTTDEQYAELYTDMSPVYDLWRQFQREQLAYREAWETRLAEREPPRRGSYQAMKQHYNNYKWEKIQRQEMKTLAEGFDNEIAPTALDLEGTVVRLSGSLDQRYREWRDILRQIYRLETGT